MAANSKIEWTDHTFNPWIGCTKVSMAANGGGGCDNCYAAVSTPARSMHIAWGAGQPRHRTAPSTWALPKRWNDKADEFYAKHGRRQRVFCASLADVFDNEVDDLWRADLWDLIEATPGLDWLLLTKRIGNVRGMANRWMDAGAWPKHARLGISVTTQAEADRDILKLIGLGVPNFLSMEPLLEAVNLDADNGLHGGPGQLDWVIVGGESGPGARPMRAAWAQAIRDRCAAAGVPFLFKQWGEWLGEKQDGAYDHEPLELNATDNPIRVGKKAAGRTLDGRTHDNFPGAA
jgi:protein gp37